jgi:hypothetical protein
LPGPCGGCSAPSSRGGKWDEAAARESLPVHEAKGPNDWSTFEARSVLGARLLGLGKTAEAEPLLRSGYEGLAKRRAAIPALDRPCLAAALDRLIAFSEATGEADDVKAWKAERAKLDTDSTPKPGAQKK